VVHERDDTEPDNKERVRARLLPSVGGCAMADLQEVLSILQGELTGADDDADLAASIRAILLAKELVALACLLTNKIPSLGSAEELAASKHVARWRLGYFHGGDDFAWQLRLTIVELVEEIRARGDSEDRVSLLIEMKCEGAIRLGVDFDQDLMVMVVFTWAQGQGAHTVSKWDALAALCNHALAPCGCSEITGDELKRKWKTHQAAAKRNPPGPINPGI
jgi:hypothetical protein